MAQPRKQAAAWCREGFLNARSLAKARDIHAQLRGHLQALGLRLASCGDDATPLRQALVMGLFPHAARRQPGGGWGTGGGRGNGLYCMARSRLTGIKQPLPGTLSHPTDPCV